MAEVTVVTITAFGMVYFGTIMFASTAMNDCEIVDAFWWPIHLVKALTKSLLRALFTGWRL